MCRVTGNGLASVLPHRGQVIFALGLKTWSSEHLPPAPRVE